MATESLCGERTVTVTDVTSGTVPALYVTSISSTSVTIKAPDASYIGTKRLNFNVKLASTPSIEENYETEVTFTCSNAVITFNKVVQEPDLDFSHSPIVDSMMVQFSTYEFIPGSECFPYVGF